MRARHHLVCSASELPGGIQCASSFDDDEDTEGNKQQKKRTKEVYSLLLHHQQLDTLRQEDNERLARESPEEVLDTPQPSNFFTIQNSLHKYFASHNVQHDRGPENSLFALCWCLSSNLLPCLGQSLHRYTKVFLVDFERDLQLVLDQATATASICAESCNNLGWFHVSNIRGRRRGGV